LVSRPTIGLYQIAEAEVFDPAHAAGFTTGKSLTSRHFRGPLPAGPTEGSYQREPGSG